MCHSCHHYFVAEMGLQGGDVITDLNGEEITSPQQSVDLYRALREGGHSPSR